MRQSDRLACTGPWVLSPPSKQNTLKKKEGTLPQRHRLGKHLEVLLLTGCPGEPLPTEASFYFSANIGKQAEDTCAQFRAAAFPNSSK